MTLIVLTKILSSYQCRISTHQCVFIFIFRTSFWYPGRYSGDFLGGLSLGLTIARGARYSESCVLLQSAWYRLTYFAHEPWSERLLSYESAHVVGDIRWGVYDFTPVLVGMFFVFLGGVMVCQRTCLICFSIFVGVGWWQGFWNMQKSKYMNIYKLYMWTWQIFMSCTYWLDALETSRWMIGFQ